MQYFVSPFVQDTPGTRTLFVANVKDGLIQPGPGKNCVQTLVAHPHDKFGGAHALDVPFGSYVKEVKTFLFEAATVLELIKPGFSKNAYYGFHDYDEYTDLNFVFSFENDSTTLTKAQVQEFKDYASRSLVNLPLLGKFKWLVHVESETCQANQRGETTISIYMDESFSGDDYDPPLSEVPTNDISDRRLAQFVEELRFFDKHKEFTLKIDVQDEHEDEDDEDDEWE